MLSFHLSIMASTYDLAESIATPPPESDFDDEQLRALLASPRHLQEREASAQRSQVYHSERENLMSSSSQDPISTGTPVARGDERVGSTTTKPMSERRPSTMNSLLPVEITTEFYGWTAKTTDIRASVKIQNPGEFLFQFSLGCYVMVQRSGDG